MDTRNESPKPAVHALSSRGQSRANHRLQTEQDTRCGRSQSLLQEGIRHEGRPPHTITLDGYAASHRAVREMRDDGILPKRTKMRSSKYLNNLIEQDHRGIKSRTRPMLGFKSFTSAANVINGIELLRRIHKRQFALSRLRRKGQAVSAIWNAVLAA